MINVRDMGDVEPEDALLEEVFKKKLFRDVQKKCGSENFEKFSEKHQ